MYTLYFSPGACSMAVHVLLNDLGVPFKLEAASPDGKNRSPEFLKINPRSAVPVLSDDGKIIREGAAIMLYLAEKHNSKLMPAVGSAGRAEALEWLMFCNATLHPAYSRAFWLSWKVGDLPSKDAYLEKVFENINNLWKDVEGRLSQSTWLAGEQMTIADVLLTVIANWSAKFPAITIGPKAKALFQRVIAQPAYQKALATEKVEYKVAA
jgi:glutathione S-transferase